MIPKGYSPTRRWLRAERAREHALKVAREWGGLDSLCDARGEWKTFDRLQPYQDDTSTDETIYVGGWRIS